MTMEAVEVDLIQRDETRGHTSCLDEKEDANRGHHHLPHQDHKNLASRIEEAQKLYRGLNQFRAQITEKIQERKLDRDRLVSSLKYLNYRDGFRWSIAWKRKQMEPLQQALDSVHCLKNPRRRRHIGSLYYRVQHGSRTLAEERKLLRQIKEAEAERDKFVAGAAVLLPKSPNTLSSKQALEDHIKHLSSSEMYDLKRDQRDFMNDLNNVKKELEGVDSEIKSMWKQMENVNRRKDSVYQLILQLRK